jgi:PAS domain S-box-containing protein
MKQNKPFPRQLALTFGLAIAAVLGGGFWYYHVQGQGLQHRVETELQGVAQLKVNQITAWRAERLRDANILMDSSLLIDTIARWLVAPKAEDAELILLRFRSMQEHMHYADVELVNTNGQIRLSLSGESGPVHAEVAPTLAQVFRDRQPALTDLHFSPVDQSPHLDIVVPLFAQNGKATEPISAILLVVDADQYLYPLIESWPTPSTSAETLLIRRDGNDALFLNDLRYKKGAALKLRFPLSKVEVPAVQAVLGRTGVFLGKDYRGVPVLSVVSAVPDSPWFMVSKMDTADAFSAWRSQSVSILALILVCAAATIAMAGMTWQRNEKTHYQPLAQAQTSLRESEENYRNLFENAQVGMYRSKMDGTAFLDVNNKFAEIIGFSRQELLGAPARIHWAKQEDRDQMLKLLEDQGGSLSNYEVQVLTKNGDSIDVIASIKLLPDEGCLEGSMVDITERKRAENALALNAVRLESLLELHKLMDAPQSQLLDFTLEASLKTTQSQFAFIGLLDDAEAVMTIHAWSKDALAQCALDDKPRRFPIAAAGIWGECVRRRAPFMLNQYDDPHPSKKGVPAGHVPIKRLLAVPMFDGDRIVAVAAVANKAEVYTESDSHALMVLLDRTWGIILRKQVEEALHESEERFRRLFNGGNDAILVYELGEDGMPTPFVEVNDVACARLGYTRAELLTMPPMAINPPESAANFPAAIKQLIKNKSLVATATHVAKDGRRIPVEIGAQVFELGGKSLVLSIARDITERKRAEEEYRTIISTALDGFWITDMQGRFLDVNDAYCHLIGYSREELLKMGVPDVEAVEKPEETARHIQKVIETGHDRFETHHRCKDGRIVDVEVSVNLQSSHGGRLYVFLRDMTERKQAEDALRQSEERLLLAVRAGTIGIWDWDIANDRLTWDDSMFYLYNIRKEDFSGAYDAWSRTLHPDDRQFTEGEIQAALRGEREYAPEFRIVRPDGAVRIIQAVSQTFRDQNGKAVRMIGTNTDITERKQAEQERERLTKQLEMYTGELEGVNIELTQARNEADRANRAKSEFLSRMSHELRTPLNSILGFSQLMEMDELPPDQREGVSQILKSGRHLLDLINEVLDISRIEAGRMELSPEAVHVEEAIQQAVDLIRPLADQRRITIHVQVPSSRDVFVTADRQRFKQVLLNLLSNAVKYNREQGEIRIIASLLVDGYLHLQVQDTGEGIPPDKMARLFNPFDRLGFEPATVEGTGLGLALSKRLVEAMSGRMGAESVVGNGSTFWLDLQLTTRQEEALVMAEMNDYLKTTPDRVAGTILYVEDDLSNITLMEKIVTWLPGIELISTMQGRMAMDLARQHKPRLILLDLNLPDVNGAEVLEWLRAGAETKDIPVVVMSADAMPSQIEHLLATGAQAYLTKPIDVKAFLKMLDEMLGSKDGKE